MLKNLFSVADIQSPPDHDYSFGQPRKYFVFGGSPLIWFYCRSQLLKLENINAFHLAFSYLRCPSLCVRGRTDDESVTR
jgi:hypothetical protein